MARSLRTKDNRNFSSSRGVSTQGGVSRGEATRALTRNTTSSSASELSEKPTWEMRMGIGQVIVLWSVLAGTMVMVFLFGLYAGREQGVKSALEQQGGEAVRLPVASPVASAENTQNSLSSPESANPVGAETIRSTAGNESGTSPSSQNPTINSAAALMGTQNQGGKAQGSEIKNDAGKVRKEAEIDFSASSAESAALSGSSTDTLGNKTGSGDSMEAGSPTATSRLESQGKNTILQKVEEKAGKEAKSLDSKIGKATTLSTETTKTIKSSAIQSGWYLQVVAARTNSEATGIIKKLQKSGISAKLEEATIGSSTYFRVITGPYQSRDAALATKKAVLKAQAAKGDPFLKQVK